MKEQYGIRSPNSGLCGLALIINISYLTIDETDGQKIKTERNGSEKDVAKLQDTLEFLNFEVEVKENLTRNEMNTAILDFVEKLNNNTVDICAVCVMSHGDENMVLSSDGHKVDIKMDILNKFSNDYCRSMIKKPKLFLLQACRGTKRDRGILVKSTRGSLETDGLTERVASVLEDSIIAYSSIPDYAAWRNVTEGSYFITILCEVFKEHASQMEIVEMFKIVTRRMKEVKVGDDNGECRTTPEVTYRIDKDLYFQPRVPKASEIREDNHGLQANEERPTKKDCCNIL